MTELKTNEDVIKAVLQKNSTGIDQQDTRMAAYVAIGTGLLTIFTNLFGLWSLENPTESQKIIYFLGIFSGFSFLIMAWFISKYVLSVAKLLFYVLLANLALRVLGIFSLSVALAVVSLIGLAMPIILTVLAYMGMKSVQNIIEQKDTVINVGGLQRYFLPLIWLGAAAYIIMGILSLIAQFMLN